MTKTRDHILAEVIQHLQASARDWDFAGEITGDTRLFADLAFESLDVVVLATTMQEKYARVFPFTDLFAAVGQREQRDISVREWADFIYDHMSTTVPALEGEGKS